MIMEYTIKAKISFESQIKIEADSIDDAKESVSNISIDQWLSWSDCDHFIEHSDIEESK